MGETYADEYIQRNTNFDHDFGAQGWKSILDKVDNNISNYLECGYNIGLNITQLGMVYPHFTPSIIEISEPAFNFVTSKYTS